MPLNLDTSHKYIAKSTLMYEDNNDTINFTEIQKIPLEQFRTLHHDIFSSPFTTSAFWYTFTVENSLDDNESVLIREKVLKGN